MNSIYSLHRALRGGLLTLVTLVAAATSAQVGPPPVFLEPFETYGAPGEPTGWFDSAPGNPENEAPGQYKTWPDPVAPGNIVFGHKGASRSLTHYRLQTFDVARGFRFEGRMMRTKTKGRLGVVFLSKFPTFDDYYQLVQENDNNPVRLSANGHGQVAGDRDSNVVLAANVWYRFRIEASVESGNVVRIRARLWPAGQSEPASWSIDVTDSSFSAPGSGDGHHDRRTGWVGVYAENPAEKYVDDLSIWNGEAPGDTDPPQIRILESGAVLPDGTLYNRPVVPVVEVVDASPVTTTTRLDGAAFTSGTAVSAEGPHGLTVTATDSAGNTSSAAVSFAIDTTPPVFVTVAPPDGSLLGTPGVTLTGRVTGATSLVVGGQPTPLTGTGGESFSFGPVTLSEGVQSFLLVAADAAGNTAQRLHTVELDTTPPSIAIHQPSDGSILPSPTVDVAGTAADAHLVAVRLGPTPALVNGNGWTLAGVTLAEGANTLTATATDALGLASTVQVTVVVDTGAPVITLLESGTPFPDGQLFRRTVVPTWGVADATEVAVEGRLNGQLTSSGTTVEADGLYELTISAIDAAGHSASRSVSFRIDRTPPAFGAVEPPDGALVGTPTVILAGVVDGDATAVFAETTAASLAGDGFTVGPLPLVEGDNRFTLRAEDAAGNAVEQEHRIERDTIAPLVTILSPAPGTLVTGSTITVTGTAVDLHLAEVRVNGVAAPLGAETFTVTVPVDDGTSQLTAVATDAVGNRGEATVTVVRDTDPPVIGLRENGVELLSGAAFNRAVTPVVEITDASELTADVRLDGTPYVSGTPVTTDGQHELAVTATDAAGNAASKTVVFTIDTAGPVFVAIAPGNGTVTAAGQVVLEVRVTGATQASVNGLAVELVGETFTAGPLVLTEGDNTFTLAAVDEVGNRTELGHRIVRDSTAPVVAISTPAAEALLPTRSATVQGTASDPRLTGVTLNGTPAVVSGGTWVATQVPLAEGENTLVAVATDAAGNSREATRQVVADTTAPEIAITDPAAGMVTPDVRVTVRGTIADPHLDRVEVGGVRATVTAGTWSAAVNLAEGENTLVATAFDRAGNRGEATVSVRRDATAPDIEIEVPAEGSRVAAATIEVSGRVTDEPGLTVTVNGRSATLTGTRFVATEVPLLAGENRLVARAVDTQGNTGTHTRIVFRDDEAPRFSAALPAPGALAVPLDGSFVLTFSEALEVPAVGALQLATAAGTALDFTVDAAGAELTVRPQSPLPSATELRLALTAGLRDLAGNALANPQDLSWSTADVGAPPAPTVAPVASALCVSELVLTGSAEPGVTVEVTGGVAAATVEVGADGAFALAVALVPQAINRLAVSAVDAAGNRSPATTVQVIADCRAPQVVAARRAGDVFTVSFDEPVAPATVPGAIRLTGADGELPGSVLVAPDGTSANFTAAEATGEELLRLEVSTAIEDHAGNALAFPFSQLFGGDDAPSFLVGTVLDDATGRPLAGARVVVVATDGVFLEEPRPEQTTGADGRFQLPIAVGTHDLTVGRPGYTPAFRSVTTRAGQGTDVFDPRLTPNASALTVGVGGGTVTSDGITVVVPAGAIASETRIAATALSEQGLPALLPYGWTPRGAVWLDLPTLTGSTAVRLPVEAADGETLVVAALELATLQWRSRGTAQVVRGQVEITVTGGGAVALVEADTGPTAPAGTVVTGQVLPSGPHPAGGEVTAASLEFDPGVVLPTQASLATVAYTLAATPPAGLPLTLVIEERLDLLDGTVRREAPYRADLVVYRAPDGAARSRFRLKPSAAAAEAPLALGTENVAVVAYGGETVRGDVVGPNGGTVTSAEGDVVELPSGAFAEPVAVTLTRRPATDLPLPVPAGSELLGLLALDLGGRRANGELTLEWAASPAPGADDRGLLLQLLDLGQGPFLRPVAALAAGGAGWRTLALDPADLPWPGVRSGGLFAAVRLTVPTGYLRGRVIDVGGPVLASAPVVGSGLGWRALSDDLGRYVLPAPVGAVTVGAENRASGNAVTAAVAITAADERVTLDLPLVILGPSLAASTPPDGAVDLPPGVQPVLTFSEPVAAASLAQGIELAREDGEVVPLRFEPQGILVRVLPEVTLTPGGRYELRVGLGVRDLAGNPLTTPVVVRFSVLRILLNADLDPTRIFTVAPNAQGRARVSGLAGAVPAFATLYVENTTNVLSTTTIQAEQDGSFVLEVEAAIKDELLLHVLGRNGEDVVLTLTPFRSADFNGAYLGPAGGRFQTPAGIVVTVPARAFDKFTLIRVVPQPPSTVTGPVPAPGFVPAYAFRVDLGGARAKKGLRVSVPAPPGADPAANYLLSRAISYFGEPKWQLDDLGVVRNGRITTEDEVAPSAAVGDPEAVEGAGFVALSAAFEAAPGPATSGPRKFLPGMWSPKRDSLHVFWSTVERMGYLTMPVSAGADYGFAMGDWAYAVSVDAALARILPEKVAIPTRLGGDYRITVRSLSTGATIRETVVAGPADGDQIVTLPRDTFDREPPFPVSGSPIRFYPIAVGADEEKEIAPGIHLLAEGDNLTLRGDAGATHPGVQIKLHGTDFFTTSAEETAEDPGSFELTASGLETGRRYTLVIGAEVTSEAALELSFNEALAEGFPGIEVMSTGEGGGRVPLDFREVRSREVVRLVPRLDWQAGETYVLRFLPNLADDYGNEWNESLDIEFKIQKALVLPGFSPLGVGRDMARMGSLLFVAAHSQGIAVLDAANPAALVGKPASDPFYPWVFGAAVRGVAIDPHGRLFATGGGDANAPGLLRAFDPLRLDFAALEADPGNAALRSAWFMGSTLVTNSVGGSINLPSGTPRKMAILSNDDRREWKWGNAIPGGLQVTPHPIPEGVTGSLEVTIQGTNGRPHMPVTVRNQTTGRMKRVDADAAGAYQLTIPAERGDSLAVLINRETVIYTAVAGGGIAVVDGNAVYQERALGPNETLSDVLNFFTGGAAAGGVNGSAVLDLGLLANSDNQHPLVVPWVGLNVGYTAMFAPPEQPSAIQVLLTDAAIGGGRVTGLDVLEQFRFDSNRDGRVDDTDQARDYLVLAATDDGVLIYDVTNRAAMVRVARIPVPGQVATVGVDRQLRRVYAAAYGGGVHVIDLPPTLEDRLIDQDGDAIDDRIVDHVEPGGTSRQIVLTVPELGVLYVGGDGPGTKAIANGGPRLAAVVRDRVEGGWRQVTRLAPFGVPTYYSDPEQTGPTEANPEAEASPPLPGAFRVLADLPGYLGPTIKLDLLALGAGGKPIFGAGDPERVPDLPRTVLEGERGLVLQRMSDTPTDAGYNRYLSEEVAVLADLRAARKYTRTEAEEKPENCFRCDLDDPVEPVDSAARELLSGYSVAVRFPAALRDRLAPLYPARRLDAAEIELASVPWAASPAIRQEPAQNPSTGNGEVVPGTLLHSGEFTRTDTDLRVKGLGFDFAFTRTYRSQTVGAGPLGPGWSHVYDQFLRELPNGDLELHDGRGRREYFVLVRNSAGASEDRYLPVTGLFVEIKRTAAGWVMKDAPRRIRRFDRFGRLLAFADPLFTEATDESGTALRFEYDATSRLVKVFAHDREIKLGYDDDGRLLSVEDHTGREVRYAYDEAGRLESATSPAVTVGAATFPDGLTSRYEYAEPAVGLAAGLNQRDNLISVTDPKGQTWLQLDYTDADSDDRPDEVTTETWGGDDIQLSYTFSNAGTETTVVDRRGHASSYTHNSAGQSIRYQDAAGYVTSIETDDEGLATVETFPRGRRVERELPGDEENRRARGNVQRETVTPGEGGPNGSPGALVTALEHDDNIDSGTNKLTLATDARGVTTRQDLDAAGLPLTVTEAEGTAAEAVTRITYDAYGQQKSVTNPNGHATTFEYYDEPGKKGYLKSVTVGGLLTTRYEVDVRGNVTAETDPRGVRHEYVYNELDWLVEERVATSGSSDGAPALSYVTTYRYDENGNLIEEIAAFGEDGSTTTTRTEYDLLDRPVRIEHPIVPVGGVAVELREYDEGSNLTRVTGPNGQTLEFTYDERGLVVEKKTGAGSEQITETFEYNGERQLELRTDGRGHVWRTVYDGYGRPMEEHDPNGNVQRTRYDANGNPTTVESFDPQGVKLASTTITYDELNRATSESRWLANAQGSRDVTTSREYDAGGNVTAETDALGRTATLVYDAAERLREATDPAGNRTVMTLDGHGNATTTVSHETGADSATVTETTRFDALGRLIALTDGAGNTSQLAYDARGNVLREIDPEGQLTTHTWNSLGQETSVVRPGGIAMNRTFDPSGRLATMSDALGNTTTWTYDTLDRVTSTAYADGTSESFEYDAAGNVVRYTDARGVVVSSVYDPGNRLTQRSAGLPVGVLGTTLEIFGYDGLDRMTVANSDGHSTLYFYDTLSRLVEERTDGRGVLYEFDDADTLTGITYPSGAHVAITPDALGRPQTIAQTTGNGAVSYGYRGQSLVARKLLGAVAGTYAYDGARRPTAIEFLSGTSDRVFGEQIEWSPRSLKKSTVRTDQNGRGQRYTVDAAGRVTTVERFQGTGTNSRPRTYAGVPDRFEFTFDAADNLLSKQAEEACEDDLQALPLDGSGRNRPGSVDGVALAWDAAGNLIQKGALRLAYDFKNRLVQVSRASGEVIARYEYDAANRRIERHVGGVAHDTVWAGWQAIEEYRNGLLASRRTFGLGLDEIVHLEMDLDGDGALESEYLPFYDSAGNLVLVTDGEGRPVERYEYSPFGERWIFVDSTPPRIEQVLAVGQEIRLELSEEVDLERLRAALGTGVTLRSQVTAGYFDLTIEQPVTEGREAGRRLVLRPADPSSWPAANEAVELLLAPGLLADHFDNVDGAGFTQSFPWPATARVVEDTTPPRVTELCVEPSGRLKLTFSETPRLADLQRITRVDGATLAWTLAEDGYTVLSNAPLAAGSHSLTILGEEPLDLAELALAAEFRRDFEVVSGAGQLAFQAPHAGQVDESTLLNVFGFHGLPRDPETGFLYARNRYYDPTMGRFVSTDPMGYVDGPNSYQFALNNPAVYSDPMGLCVLGLRCRDLPGFYWDYLKGVTSDLGGMALGLADLATLGTISDARTSLATFREAEGSLIDRYAAARIAGLKARMNTVTLGFSGAEDKTDHLKTLIGFKQLEQAGTLLGTAVANGDWEMGLEGVGKLLEGAGALAGTVSLAAGPAAKAGIIPRPGMAVARSASSQAARGGFVENAVDYLRGVRLRQITRQAVREVDSAIVARDVARLRSLGAGRGEALRVLRGGSQAEKFRGSIIDTVVKNRARQSFGLRSLRYTERFQYGPDIINPRTMRAWDITTPSQWSRHVRQYITQPPSNRPQWRALEPLFTR